MKIYKGEMPCIKEKTAVALGNFDAVHIGHTKVIGQAVSYAKNTDCISLVCMFENTPSDFVNNNPPREINSLEKRLSILESMAVDIAVILKFDEKIMNMSCEDFVKSYIVDIFNAKYVVTGDDFRFGKNGCGDTEKLRSECVKYGVKSSFENEVTYDGVRVSSTDIKEMIACGNVEKAAKLMGRYYSMRGKVIKGNGIGLKKLNFPTANIEIPKGRVLPKNGVYATLTTVDGKEYKSITNIGAKPTVNDFNLCAETHILGNFNELYGKNIEIEFVQFVREIKKFENINELKAQLEKDKEKIIKFYITNYEVKENEK